MEPIKFEKYIKERLDDRKIQPSMNAWDALENRLDGNEKTKTNKGFWWLGIAASFVGFLVIMTIVSNSKETENSNPIIVETEAMDQEEATTTIVESDDQTIEKKDSEIKSSPLNNISVSKEQAIKKQSKVTLEKIDEALVQNKPIQERPLVLEISDVKTAVTFEEQKVLDVVNQIKKLQMNNTSVSEHEINALLMVAQKEIALNKIYDDSSNTVNADALLQDVENDLNESFRNRVFKALRSGYENVKTAVAERNN